MSSFLIKTYIFLLILSIAVTGLYAKQPEPAESGVDGQDLAFSQCRDGAGVSGSIDLNGAWQFKAIEENEWLDANVPGTVWEDLMRCGRIKEDPFYRDNELKVQWVEKKEWEYRKKFTVTAEFLKHDKIVLDCRGLDTIAEIWLNGTLVANTINMFIEYEFDVKRLLKPGENDIHILFRSILEWNKQQVAADPKVSEKLMSIKGNVFFARKEGSDFGWDWGVRLLTCGIWRPIRLAAYDTGRIIDLGVRQDLADPNKAVLNVTAELEQFRDKNLSMQILVSFKDKILQQQNFKVASNRVNARLTIKDPQLWWPNGWGEHPLYTVESILKDGKQVVHRKKIRIGLRTVKIVREKDERGESFGIKFNGHLIFCKGGNWIPADALPNRLTEEHYRRLLGSCVEANMNMIRIWGGGLYEPDIFYEFCDENGLMVWHDFAFAVGPYIASESYLENVRQEITSVVRRLRHHPSIAIWCGNNESESNMAGGQQWIKNYDNVDWQGYDRIFHELIPETAALYDPDRDYWPSSPHHPLDRAKQNPDWETSSGNVHTYEVWGGSGDFSPFREMGQYRFVAEFGFQSLPDMETIRSFTAPEDRYFSSRIIDHHEKSGGPYRPGSTIGTTKIAKFTADMFLIPNGLENWVYVSQLLQAEGMKMGCEALRRNYPASTGALYWQLNDNWPVTSWSSMDYFGRWKALQYMAGDFFSPVLVCDQVQDTKVKIYGVNDLLEDIPATLTWELGRFDGTVAQRGELNVLLPANRSTPVTELDFNNIIAENPDYITYRKFSYENRGQYYFSYKLVQENKVLSSNTAFFVLQKYLQLKDPHLNAQIQKVSDGFTISITADRFAAYVCLGLKEKYARFSDNYFHLLPGEVKKVRVIESEVSEDEFKKLFRVKSLIDSFR
ncbi:glycoside hydrolase family 2 protein [candidate division KSB1 bacterium]|nr:glycoside hydrolase family 2 protein [candidate division KSB1 bacterium]